MSKQAKQHLLLPQLRYAAIMMVATLTLGVFFREFTRFVFKALSLEQQLQAGYYISQAHGHTFAIGFVIPALLAALTHMVMLALDPPTLKRLRRLFTVYMAGGALTILLLLYKGIAFAWQLGQNPALALDTVDAGLYWGSVMIRSTVYSVAHIAFGVTVGWYLILLVKRARAAWA
ncbi:MAG: DUF2871 family protein [Anaerolineae bacterium]|nr:DUF2871 family protein [Anaerolineae bacterium]